MHLAAWPLRGKRFSHVRAESDFIGVGFAVFIEYAGSCQQSQVALGLHPLPIDCSNRCCCRVPVTEPSIASHFSLEFNGHSIIIPIIWLEREKSLLLQNTICSLLRWNPANEEN